MTGSTRTALRLQLATRVPATAIAMVDADAGMHRPQFATKERDSVLQRATEDSNL